jgi:hypothetical protein
MAKGKGVKQIRVSFDVLKRLYIYKGDGGQLFTGFPVEDF